MSSLKCQLEQITSYHPLSVFMWTEAKHNGIRDLFLPTSIVRLYVWEWWQMEKLYSITWNADVN